MDIQAVAQQLLGYLGNDPQLITQFIEHPYSTTASATGSDQQISKTDMSQILTQVAAQTSNQNISATDISGLASVLMGQSNGSVHELASTLFGGSAQAAEKKTSKTADKTTASAAPSMAEIAAKSVMGGVAARGMASLITSALGANDNTKKNTAAAQSAQMPDLSSLAKLAEGLLGK